MNLVPVQGTKALPLWCEHTRRSGLIATAGSVGWTTAMRRHCWTARKRERWSGAARGRLRGQKKWRRQTLIPYRELFQCVSCPVGTILSTRKVAIWNIHGHNTDIEDASPGSFKTGQEWGSSAQELTGASGYPSRWLDSRDSRSLGHVAVRPGSPPWCSPKLCGQNGEERTLRNGTRGNSAASR